MSKSSLELCTISLRSVSSTTRLLTGILTMPNRRSRTPVPPHSHWEHLALSCAANQHACSGSYREPAGHSILGCQLGEIPSLGRDYRLPWARLGVNRLSISSSNNHPRYAFFGEYAKHRCPFPLHCQSSVSTFLICGFIAACP